MEEKGDAPCENATSQDNINQPTGIDENTKMYAS